MRSGFRRLRRTLSDVHTSRVDRAGADDVRERLKLGNSSGQAMRPWKDETRQQHILVRPGTGPVGTGGIGQNSNGVQPRQHYCVSPGPDDDP